MLHLHGLGHFHPDNQISNAFLESLDIGTDEAWILDRVGIRNRYTALDLDYIRSTRNADPRAAAEAAQYSHAETGRAAALMAIERAGLTPGDIGMVVAGSSLPDTAVPAEACNIAAALNLDVPAFDINSACTTFFAGIWTLERMRPEGLPEFILTVVPEAYTRAIDYRDRSSAVLWGDGTVAAVVAPRRPGRARILGPELGSRPSGAARIVVPRTGHFRQDGRAVQAFAVRKTRELLGRLIESRGDTARPLHFVGHQANLRMLESVCRMVGVPDELHHSNVVEFGNTGGASAGSVVSQAWQDFKDGDDIAMVGVGAGLTWASFLLRFGADA
ncbi:MAG: ketoacyl-ACP synthase III [Deltaproteobacteria bacterium]